MEKRAFGIQRETLERLRKQYPAGCRVELLKMDDKHAPPLYTKGTVAGVDDIGSIMVRWDTGSSLSVVYGEDVCRRCDEESTEPPKKNDNRIEIRLPNSFRLVAERNPDAAFDRELYIGIVDDSGVWYQDLAIVRNAYEIDEMMNTVWKEDEFEILVYSDKDDEDYTHAFRVEMNRNGSI